MAASNDGNSSEQPMIRFGGEWVPAHDVWKKMETVTVVVDAIDRFNAKFPELASDNTRDVVPLVRQRLKDIELRMPHKAKFADLSGAAIKLLQTMSPEQAIATLAEQHDAQVDLTQLVQLAGEKAYVQVLQREARELEQNRISVDQTARLWNDSHRPAPGGGLWTAKKVAAVLADLS